MNLFHNAIVTICLFLWTYDLSETEWHGWYLSREWSYSTGKNIKIKFWYFEYFDIALMEPIHDRRGERHKQF